VALGISQAELARLLDPSVIELNGQPVPSWLNTYQSLVHGAGGLCEVDLYLIPGLLQTGAYAAAVERTSPLGLSESQIAERVDVRLARQEVLWRDPDPLQLVVVVPESVLREAVGGPAVMLDQLDHLAGMCRRRNVDIRILPPDGRGAFALNGFELLTRPGETAPFIAVADSVAGPHYAELPEAVARFRVAFDLLIHIALPPDESARRIEEIREIYR
jgi:hypothetical protein